MQGSNLSPPPSSSFFLRYAEKYHTWTVYCFLLCPSALADPRNMAMLRVTLNDSFVVPLFREEMLFIQDEFEQLFSWYPPKGSPVKFPEKPKKQIVETIKDSLQRMPFQHIEQRNLCRHELSRLLKLVEDTPGLIAPKYPVVMSCLALARVELLWYFRHTGRPPPRAYQKYHSPELFVDASISELIALCDDMVRPSVSYGG